MKKTHVLVVTSHAILKEGICHLLADPLERILLSGVKTFPEFLDLIQHEMPDVIVLAEPTFGLPVSFILRKIRQLSKHSRIVYLQYGMSVFSHYRLFQLGVCAVLGKCCTVEDLRKAVRNAEIGRPFVTEYAAEWLMRDLGESRAPHTDFSEREAETFFMIINGFTTTEIAKILCVNVNVISMRKSAIKKRLNVRNESEIVQYAFLHDIVRTVE